MTGHISIYTIFALLIMTVELVMESFFEFKGHNICTVTVVYMMFGLSLDYRFVLVLTSTLAFMTTVHQMKRRYH